MNFNDLQNAWNSDANRPIAAQREKLTQQFVNTLRRQRRNQLIWLVWTFFLLTVMTGWVGWIIFGTNKIDLASEWGVLPLILIPWSVAVLFLKRFLKPVAPLCRGDVMINDALTAAVVENGKAQSRLKIVGAMYVVFIPVLACTMWQLQAVGKASSREMLSMTIFFATLLGVCAAGVFARYRFRLVPQQKHLEEILKQFA